MNTDQAFDLLQDAGVLESISIQTVRRWLREDRIKYEGGNGNRRTGYIIDDLDQVFDLLKDARVTESTSVQTIRRWLREGKIKYKEGNGSRETQYISDETASRLLINDRIDQNMDGIIHHLKSKIEAQDKYIEGIEELHGNAKKGIIQQRDKFKKEVITLKNVASKLENEAKELLTQNIELRNDLRKLKETKRDNYHFTSITQSNNYSEKFGFSKMASDKEVLTEYKGLLRITHPDHGSNAKLFHYIRTDYENFKKSIKDK